MLVATAGHVDHGKTSLIKALTNIDTDRLAQEKKRGLTIDLGFAYQSMGSAGTIGFIDVPGHEKFLSNMLSGVAGIDLVMLVIAADDGPMPQTREHLSILELLGINNGVVVLTKTDCVTEDRIIAVRAEIELLTKNTFLSSCPIFPVSSLQQTGMTPLADFLNTSAEKMPATVKADHRFRLAIDRWFFKKGHGLIVTGTVFSGTAVVGEQLKLSHAGVAEKELSVRVRSIYANGEEANKAVAGQRCALNISGRGLELADISRGDWLLCSNPSAPSQQLDIRLSILATEKQALPQWSPVHIHIGASHTTGRVVILRNQSIRSQSATPQPAIEPNTKGLARLMLDSAVYAVAGDHFIIRDQSSQRTIGGGTVIDAFGLKRGRASIKRLQALQFMESNDHKEAIHLLLEQTPKGLNLTPIIDTWNLGDAQAQRLISEIEAVILVDTTFSLKHWQFLTEKIIHFVRHWTREHPEHQGIAPEHLWKQLDLKMNWSTLVEVTNRLLEQKQLIRTGHLIHNPGHIAQIAQQDRDFWHLVRPYLEDNIPCPPVVHDLANSLEIKIDELRDNLERLTYLGWLIKVGPNRYFTANRLRQLAEQVSSLVETAFSDDLNDDLDDDLNDDLDDNTVDHQSNSPELFSPAQFRDASGIGRRPCIDILEFFDSCGFTQRINNYRKVIQHPAVIFPNRNGTM